MEHAVVAPIDGDGRAGARWPRASRSSAATWSARSRGRPDTPPMTDRDVRVYEVGPRDGLQNEAAPIPTDAKLRFIDLLADAGLRRDRGDQLRLAARDSRSWPTRTS